MSLLAVYGTLRKGDVNSGFLRGYNPLITERVEGFEMYNLGGAYPYVARGADSITVEVYDVPPEAVAPIERMERRASYDMTKVKTSVGLADIFYMDEEAHARRQSLMSGRPPRVMSGDWFEWLKKYKPGRVNEGEE